MRMVNALAPRAGARHGSGRRFKTPVPRKAAPSSPRSPARRGRATKAPGKPAATRAPKASSVAASRRDPAAVIEALTRRLARARRQIAALEARADTDALLDIPNRRGFERELKRAIAYLRRYRASAALLIADVDRLKPVNDTFGHAAGDHMLKAVVSVLAANTRQSDVLARLGGDEFAMLLWNLSEQDAQAKATALERAVDGAVCDYRGRVLRLGVSLGITMLGADDDVQAVLERADQAMYARKQARGRSRKPRKQSPRLTR